MSEKLLDQNLGRIWASLIINELINNDVTQFYLSPGMRNAPLIAALNHLKKFNPSVDIKLCVDERAAAYRALGYSKGNGKASALICTSGTAMANYMPAVIEAKKSNVPLIVITADRPPELTHCDDNQTIDQTKFYGDFISGELYLGAPSIEIDPWALSTSLSNLINKAFYPQKGPVHFNCSFREPLEETETYVPDSFKKQAALLLSKNTPTTKYLNSETTLSKDSIFFLANEINQTQNGLLVIGSLNAYDDFDSIKSFIKLLNWPTYFDVSSSIKYEFNLQDNTLPTFDHPEVQEEFVKNKPDTILHIGGRLTSKHYYTYLKQVPDINLITLNKNIEKEDPSHHTRTRVNADIGPVIKELIPLIKSPKGHTFNKNGFIQFVENKSALIDRGPLSFPKISKTIIDNIEANAILYLGNSTAVRSFDSYVSNSKKKQITVATNRGVSGIEGFIASSVGLMDALKKSVYLVFGDISFIHDLNSLYFLTEEKLPLKIILINNFSGGIFTLLPINKEKEVLNYVASPHQHKFKKAAELVNIQYLQVTNEKELLEKFDQLQKANSHTLLEIFVDNDINKSVYDQLKTIKL